MVVRNENGNVIGIFNQLTLKDQRVHLPIAQFSLAGDTLIVLALSRLWRIKLSQTVVGLESFGN